MMDQRPAGVINIDMDRKCSQCGRKGAGAKNGICLGCLAKNLKAGKYDHILKGKGPVERLDSAIKAVAPAPAPAESPPPTRPKPRQPGLFDRKC